MVISRVIGFGEVVIVLVELGLVELRYQAVLEVVNQGATVTDVAVLTRSSVPVRRPPRNDGLVTCGQLPADVPERPRPDGAAG